MEQVRATNQQGSQGAQAVRGKPSVQGRDSLADAQAGAVPGGFMALLAALGDGNLQEAVVPQAAGEDAFATEPVAADAGAQAVLQGALFPWQWPAVMGAGAPGAGGMVPGQDAAAGTATPLVSVDADVDPLSQAVLQGDAVVDDERSGAAENQGVASAAGAAGKRKAFGRLGAGSSPLGDVGSAAGVQGLSASNVKGQNASAIPVAAVQSFAVERARDTAGAVRDAALAQEMGSDGVPAALAQLVSDPAVASRVLARGVESGATASGAGGAAEPVQDHPMGLPGEAGAEIVDPAMAGAEDAVAEQVAYWVHQNIQNARLTVKHDGQPVEVSVSLTGNEAHVAFGSDEAQTREMIDGSVAQLRDMLHREGLVLSGVTVGESGRRQGDGGGGAGGQKNPQRLAEVVAPAAAARTPGRVNVLGDRAVDIFV